MGQLTPAQNAGGASSFVGAGTFSRGATHSPCAISARCTLTVAIVASLALAISACGRDKSVGLGERVIPLGKSAPKGGGRYHVGKSYEIAGQRYTPHENPTYDRKGTASWYGELFHGRRTANGEIYDMDRLSAAHPTLPLPVYAHVTNLRNGRSLVVRVNDRGPFKKNRIIDLSQRSAEVLGFKRQGTAPVRVRYLRRAPLSGDDSYERKYLAARGYRQYASKLRGARDASDPITVASLPQTLPPLPDRRPATASPPSFAADAPSQALTSSVDLAALEGAPDETGAIPQPSHLAPPQATSLGGPAIQAGSFKDKDNAMRAMVTLAGIGQVDVSAVEVGAETYYRVRVGPFADAIEAAAALPLLTDAGYHGAKIVLQN